MAIIKSKKVTSFREQIQRELVPPDVYKYIPSTVTGDANIKEYTGVSINTYYKGSNEYITVGRNYLKFKSVALLNNFIPSEDSLNPENIETISGYDESVSAIKNFITLFSSSGSYNTYLNYIDEYLNVQTQGGVDSFTEFYRQNSSFTANTSIDYVDSIHVITINNDFFKFSSLVDILNANFVLLKLDDFNYKMGSILNYNIINDLKYRDLIGYDDSKIEINCGVVYEDGTIIICTPSIVNSNNLSSTVVKSTCLGTLSGVDKYTYLFNYATSGSITSTIQSYQKVLTTQDYGDSFSAVLSGTAFPEGIVKGFSKSVSSISAAITNEAFSNLAASSHQVNWTSTGSPDGYTLLRNTATIIFAPVDGNTYTSGATASDGSLIVYDGTSLSASSTGLTAGILFNYALIMYKGAGASRNYYSPRLDFSGVLLAVEPTAQPTSLTSTGRDSTSAAISFIAASPTAERYLTTYRAGSDVSQNPTDGQGYSPGDTISTDTIAATGSGISFNFTGLTPQTRYYLKSISYNGTVSGSNYYTATGASNTHNFYTLSTKPVSYASAFVISSRTANSIQFSFTAPSPAVSGNMSLIKASVLPNPTINSATAYADGSTMSDSSISVSSVTSTSISAGSLSPDTEYYIKIVSYNKLTGVDLTANYLTTNTLTGSVWTLASIPTAQPTSFVISNRNTTSASIAWTASSPTSERYFILYRASASVTASPANGSHYSAWSLLTGSTTDYVSYTGTGVGFSLTGLSPGTQYHLNGRSYNGQARPSTSSTGSNHYLSTSPLTSSFWTLTAEPAAASQPAGFSLISKTNVQIVYSFTNGSPIPSGYINLRKASSLPNIALVLDGSDYADGSDLGSGTISVSSITSTTITNSSLSPKTQYYFIVAAYNRVSGQVTTSNYKTDNNTLSGSIWTLDTEPSAQPTSLVISGRNSSSASIAWTAATSTTGYLMLIKSASSLADAPVDAIVYLNDTVIGTSTVTAVTTSVTSTLLTLSPQTQYAISLFSYNKGTDDSTINYKTGTPLTGSFYSLSTKPTSGPVSMTFNSISTTGLTVSYSSPAVTGCMVMRKVTLPNPTITDGTPYADGSTMSDSSISVSSVTGGAIGTCVNTGLTQGTLYYFKIVTYNQLNTGAASSTINYYTTTTLTGSVYTLKTEPTGEPTGINLVSVSSRTAYSLTINFTKGTGADGTLFISNDSASSSYLPVDATYYTIGQYPNLDHAGVTYTGSGTANITLTNNLINPDTIHYITGYSYAEPNINYKTNVYLYWTCRTLALKPTVAPSISGTTISTTSAQINVSNVSNDGTAYMYVYKVGSDFTSEAPVDGQYYNSGDAFGAGYVIGITGVNQGITYSNSAIKNSQIFIKVYSKKGVNDTTITGTSNAFLTTTVSITSFWLSPTTPNPTTDLTYTTIGDYPDGDVSLTYTLPAELTGVMIIKKSSTAAFSSDSYPVNGVAYTAGSAIGSGGATIIYKGSASSYLDSDVSFRRISPPAAGGNYRWMVIPYQESGTAGTSNVAYSVSGSVQQVYVQDLQA